MNTDIMKSLKNIHDALKTFDHRSYDQMEWMINELEMMKMEMEQHISNMPKTTEYESLRLSAANAVKNIEEIIELFEDLEGSNKNDQEDTISEIIELMDEINY